MVADAVRIERMSDAAGVNVFTSTPGKAVLAGSGDLLVVNKLDSVDVTRASGLYNSAYLHDSLGNDVLVSEPTYAVMMGAGYLVRTKLLNAVYVYYKYGDTDTAGLYGPSNKDIRVAADEYVKLSGTTTKFLSWAKGFQHVYAYGRGGTDNATLTDAVLTEGELAVSDLSSSHTEALWMSSFASFTKKDSGTEQTVEAIDTVYTAYW